jgi:hypothetical protein
MSYGDWLFAERIMDLRVEEELGRAAARRRAHEAGVLRHAGLSWHGRWLLCGLGYRLVALGAWLEAVSLPQALSTDANGT